jgi:hypothetical protein
MILSHYTTSEAAEKILSSELIWATEYNSTNDPTEFLYAMHELTIESLKIVRFFDREKQFKLDDIELNSELLRGEIMKRLDLLSDQSDGYNSVYISSFSIDSVENSDRGILSMWRAYARDGYCINFHQRMISNLIFDEKHNFSYNLFEMRPVNYGIDKFSSDFKNIARQQAYRIMVSLSREGYKFDLRSFANKICSENIFLRDIAIFCATHKHPDWKDEREFRIIAMPSNLSKRTIISLETKNKTIYKRGFKKRYIKLFEDKKIEFRTFNVLLSPFLSIKNTQIPSEIQKRNPLQSRIEARD